MKFNPLDLEAREFEFRYGLVPHQFAMDSGEMLLRFKLMNEDRPRYPEWAAAWNMIAESIKRVRIQ